MSLGGIVVWLCLGPGACRGDCMEIVWDMGE